MARKPMMIEESIEFDPTVQSEADEARAQIAEAQRAARRKGKDKDQPCLLYTSPSPRDGLLSRMPSSA